MPVRETTSVHDSYHWQFSHGLFPALDLLLAVAVQRMQSPDPHLFSLSECTVKNVPVSMDVEMSRIFSTIMGVWIWTTEVHACVCKFHATCKRWKRKESQIESRLSIRWVCSRYILAGVL